MKIKQAIDSLASDWRSLEKIELFKRAKSKINIGHDYIYERHPIGVPFVAKWKVVVDPGVDTMCTDGKTLRYNPEFTEKLSVNACKFVVLHEAGHCLFAHPLRRDDRNPDLFNVAADLAMNSHFIPYIKELGVWDELVEDIGILLPRYGKFEKLPEFKSTEWYYHELEQELYEPPPPPGGRPCDDGKPGGKGTEPCDDSTDSGDDKDKDQGKGQGKSQDQDDGKGKGGDSTDKGDGKAGVGTKSLSERLKDFLGDEGKIVGAVADSATLLEEGADVAENEYTETVSEAVVLMKTQGTGFGTDIDWLEDMLTRKAYNDVSWLKKHLVKHVPGGRNHKRINKRFPNHPILLPKNEAKGKSHGIVMVDTSGSMGNAECDEAFVQMSKIIREFPHTKVTLVQCDTEVHEDSIKEFTRSDFPIRVPRSWMGRGGTDMEPVLKWAKDNRHKFDWGVCITDMEWDWEKATDCGIPTKFVGVNPCEGKDHKMAQRNYSYVEVHVRAGDDK